MTSEPRPARHIFVCGDNDCRKRADCKLKKQLRRALAKHCPDHPVKIVETECLGKCDDGPIVALHPDNLWFAAVDKKTARAIVKRVIRSGKEVEGARLLRPSLRRIRPYLR